MNRNEELFTVADILCIVVAGIFVLGMLFLVVRLKSLQVDSSANYNYANVRQSERRVQTEGLRGRILDRNGNILAGNRT